MGNDGVHRAGAPQGNEGAVGAKRSFAPWADPAARPLVRFEAVSKSFGGVRAVDRLSLDIYPREFFALLGPSGCGKSTLLRMLAGFESPDAGRILLDGEDVADVPPYQRPVNMMFQSYALFPHLTVAGNVAFGLKQEGLAKSAIEERVRDMLALVKLEGFERRKPHQLSGGQRQRVALARALVKRPKVFLLDEPLAALDKKLRTETQFELMELQDSLGIAFVIVTHDQVEAMTMADRIGVMDHGRLVQVASPSEIYEQPASRWVASFIGDVNLIEGRVTGSDSLGVLIQSDATGRLRVAAGLDAKEGSAVTVAIRPEKIAIMRDAPQAFENCVAGVVHDIGYLGDVSVYKVRLDSGFIMTVTAANVTRLVERPIEWDDRVYLTWAANASVILTQ